MIPRGLTCVVCGDRVQSIPALEPSGEHRAHVVDYLWVCGTHRTAMARLMGEVVGQSPGRPARPVTATDRARALRSAGHPHRSQQPAAPRMPRPGQSRPGASPTSMPVVSAWT